MKTRTHLFWISIGLFMTLFACSENKIKVSEGRMDLAEPDKEIRIEYEIKESLSKISKEITNSDNIESCENGKKLINSGVEILPYLKVNFLDSTETEIYSVRNKRNLTVGETAIIIASAIKHIPIARVVGIQQCIPPFDMDIESYFWRIQENPNEFIKNYTEWLKEEM